MYIWEKDRRIIEFLDLEGTSEGHLAQLSCNEKRCAQLDQLAQGLFQPHCENLQGQDIDHISGQPVLVPYHPHCKSFSSYAT